MYELIQAKQMSFDLWLTIKVWGVTALSFLFTLSQLPVMLKNGLAIPEEASEPAGIGKS
jgi:intracellular septation protein